MLAALCRLPMEGCCNMVLDHRAAVQRQAHLCPTLPGRCMCNEVQELGRQAKAYSEPVTRRTSSPIMTSYWPPQVAAVWCLLTPRSGLRGRRRAGLPVCWPRGLTCVVQMFCGLPTVLKGRTCRNADLFVPCHGLRPRTTRPEALSRGSGDIPLLPDGRPMLRWADISPEGRRYHSTLCRTRQTAEVVWPGGKACDRGRAEGDALRQLRRKKLY